MNAGQCVSAVPSRSLRYAARTLSTALALLLVLVPGPSWAAGGGAGAWIPTGAMVGSRYLHAATLLANGKVLIAGGNTNAVGALATAELYDPATGTFTTTGLLLTPRYEHTATLLPNGKVLIAGGCCDTSSLASAELYDPTTGTFSATGSLLIGRYNHTATLLPNGKVLIAGGMMPPCYSGPCTAPPAELYDPATGTFTATGTLITQRELQTATLLPTGQVLIAGGMCVWTNQSQPPCSNSYLASAELYDPATGTFTTTGSMAAPRLGHTAALLPTGKVLVAGGSNSVVGPLASAELYNPAMGTFSPAASMSTPRDYHTESAVSLLPTGQVLVAGGMGNSVWLNSAELYDPVANVWTPTGSLAVARYLHTATLLPTGQLLVTGGSHDCCSDGLASAEVYTPLALATSASSGVVLQTVAVTSTAFSTGELVALHWDNPSTAALTTTTAGANGSFSASPGIPSATGGRHTLIAVGQHSHTAAFAFIQVKPRVILLPAVGQAGATTTALGFGFAAREQVKLYWDRPATLLGSALTDGQGSVTGAAALTSPLPSGAGTGVHLIYGVGQTSHTVAVDVFVVR